MSKLLIGSLDSTTSRRRYGPPSALLVDSALAMFDTATSMRVRWTASAEALAVIASPRVAIRTTPYSQRPGPEHSQQRPTAISPRREFGAGTSPDRHSPNRKEP